MGGGIDKQIDRFYDGMAQRAAMDRIAARFYGELPVGAATITMHKNGDIMLEGRQITLKASADLILKGQRILQN